MDHNWRHPPGPVNIYIPSTNCESHPDPGVGVLALAQATRPQTIAATHVLKVFLWSGGEDIEFGGYAGGRWRPPLPKINGHERWVWMGGGQANVAGSRPDFYRSGTMPRQPTARYRSNLRKEDVTEADHEFVQPGQALNSGAK
ncbi:unnamed protein product [Tuber aestivum]|uniref:Uncharacterized protein n=1 Tax=Tuber aestivum TaxID=59557 RepID=A0A292PWU6_9PEZI|nr:unnamed protein product [Tuber aestivum]